MESRKTVCETAAAVVAVAALVLLPGGCATGDPHEVSPASTTTLPLLGSSRGGSPRWDFCRGQPDDAVLPADPRSLVQPGTSDGRAVYFNAFYKDCHVDPQAVQETGAAATCGELRARFDRGEGLLHTGGPAVGGLFSGTNAMSVES